MAGNGLGFKDYLPLMAKRLGPEGLIGELCNGFRLLMDAQTGLITFESLRRNSAQLGVERLEDEEVLSMLREGDLDGDGCLDQMEFCILMFGLSPGLMEVCGRALEEDLVKDFMH